MANLAALELDRPETVISPARLRVVLLGCGT